MCRTRHVWRRTNTGITLPSCCSLWWWRIDIETNDRTVFRYEFGRPACSKPLTKVNTVHILSMTTFDVCLLPLCICCCVSPLHCCHDLLSISERYWLRICLEDQRHNVRFKTGKNPYFEIAVKIRRDQYAWHLHLLIGLVT